MVFKDNFMASPHGIGAVMYDAVLKLRLTTGRWNPESVGSGGDIVVQLHHDPDIEAGKFTMPLSPEQQAFKKKWGGGSTETSFVSEQSASFAEVLAAVHKDGNDISLHCAEGSDNSFKIKKTLLERTERSPLSDHPWGTLLYFLRSIPKLPSWKKEFVQGEGGSTSLFVPESIALELVEHTDFVMPEGDASWVLISRQEHGQ